jgi:hypothetical protein
MGQEDYKINLKECCFNYISTSYVRAYGMEEITLDPFYKRSFEHVNTIRVDIGAQVSPRIGIDFGYTHTTLWQRKKLYFDEELIKSGGRSDASISFSTIRLSHNLPILKEKILFTSGLGYALGKSKVPLQTLGPSDPNVFSHGGLTYSESSTVKGLHSGYSHFLTMDLGLEILIFEKFSLFSKVSYYKGFKDLQEQKIAYDIMGEEGNVNITTNGSFVGVEFGLKFKFFPYFMRPVTKKVKSIMGVK